MPVNIRKGCGAMKIRVTGWNKISHKRW